MHALSILAIWRVLSIPSTSGDLRKARSFHHRRSRLDGARATRLMSAVLKRFCPELKEPRVSQKLQASEHAAYSSAVTFVRSGRMCGDERSCRRTRHRLHAAHPYCAPILRTIGRATGMRSMRTMRSMCPVCYRPDAVPTELAGNMSRGQSKVAVRCTKGIVLPADLSRSDDDR
jgi:hypothetical protein